MEKKNMSMIGIEEHIQKFKCQQLMSTLVRGQPPPLARTVQEVSQLRFQVKMTALQTANNHNNGKYHLITTTSSHNKIHVSKIAFKNLKKTTLKHLCLEEAAKSRYIILRTLEPAFKSVGISTVVEDADGNVVLFSAYNFTADPHNVLPVGTVFILKEPYIKIAANGECLVLCDCPSDMIVLHKGHELFSLAEGIAWKNPIDAELLVDSVLPKTASDCKKRGNALYKLGKFEFSTSCYLLGLQKLAQLGDEGPMVQILQANLSAAYLRLGFFEKAFDFAEKVLKVEPGSRKALLRAGRSCYRLRKYQDAKRHFEKCHGLYPDDKETNIEFQKAKDRCFEQETGEFNMQVIVSKTFNSLQKIDCADYVGPIKVVAIQGKGRGVVATKDVEPGTLLVVSKALVFEWNLKNKTQLEVNVDQVRDLKNRPDLVAELAQLIAKNPHTFGPIVYDLFDGTEHVNDVSAVLFCDPDTKQEPIVDVQRLKDILRINCFGGISRTPTTANPHGELYVHGSGLYAVPSYFNHSCSPNATYHVFNDVIYIGATTYIKAEEEVFLAYFDTELPFLQRQNICEKRGFHCYCELCNQDRTFLNIIQFIREFVEHFRSSNRFEQ